MRRIQFQTAADIDAARRQHLKRTTLAGGAAGAAGLGAANYLLTSPYLGKGLGRVAAATGAIKGGIIGGGLGLGLGLLTRPRKSDVNRYRERREALAELSAKLDDLIQFQDPRNRNDLGQFTGAEGSPDPNAMEKTYRSGLHKGILEGATTAAIGGGSGVLATSALKNLGARLKAARKGKASRIILP